MKFLSTVLNFIRTVAKSCINYWKNKIIKNGNSGKLEIAKYLKCNSYNELGSSELTNVKLKSLRQWIPVDKLFEDGEIEIRPRNFNFIWLLEYNASLMNTVDWKELSLNPNAVSILEKNLDKVDWCALSSNPNAIHILRQNLDKIEWKALSGNPNAISILEQNLEKINWKALSGNLNAISILKKNLHKIDWKALSGNTNAVPILEDYFNN